MNFFFFIIRGNNDRYFWDTTEWGFVLVELVAAGVHDKEEEDNKVCGECPDEIDKYVVYWTHMCILHVQIYKSL